MARYYTTRQTKRHKPFDPMHTTAIVQRNAATNAAKLYAVRRSTDDDDDDDDDATVGSKSTSIPASSSTKRKSSKSAKIVDQPTTTSDKNHRIATVRKKQSTAVLPETAEKAAIQAAAYEAVRKAKAAAAAETEAEMQKRKRKPVPVDDDWIRTPMATADVQDFIVRFYGQFFVNKQMTSAQDDASLRRFQKTASLDVYGEIYPSGVDKILNADHLMAKDCTTFGDFGCGPGKILIQALLQYPNIQRLIGVELMDARVDEGVAAFRRMAAAYPNQFRLTEKCDDDDRKSNNASRYVLSFQDTPMSVPRHVELRRGDLFEESKAIDAQIVLFEVMLPGKHLADRFNQPAPMAFLRNLRVGTRILTYEPFDCFAKTTTWSWPFAMLNESPSVWHWISRDEGFQTSWKDNYCFSLLQKIS